MIRCWRCGELIDPKRDCRPFIRCRCGAMNRNPNFWNVWWRKKNV